MAVQHATAAANSIESRGATVRNIVVLLWSVRPRGIRVTLQHVHPATIVSVAPVLRLGAARFPAGVNQLDTAFILTLPP
jgi:hypothetical protein